MTSKAYINARNAMSYVVIIKNNGVLFQPKAHIFEVLGVGHIIIYANHSPQLDGIIIQRLRIKNRRVCSCLVYKEVNDYST